MGTFYAHIISLYIDLKTEVSFAYLKTYWINPARKKIYKYNVNIYITGFLYMPYLELNPIYCVGF